MAEAIFLSAGVPDPHRGPEFAATADTVAIAAAVAALVYVTLGRRLVVWGGHPAITPMIWVVARDIGVDYGKWVRLYQSRYFEDEFPEDDQRFQNVQYVSAVSGNREKSLLAMRTRMLSDDEFAGAVFIGGMDGVIQEFELFRTMHPRARVVPVASTGGAARSIARGLDVMAGDLSDDMDYVALFHRHLEIPTREDRFTRPEEQPSRVEDRYWQSKLDRD